jgi:hypothetical protein
VDIQTIRDLVRAGKRLFTSHARREAARARLTTKECDEAIFTGDIIDERSTHLGTTYLVEGETYTGRVVRASCAVKLQDDDLVVLYVTVYTRRRR